MIRYAITDAARFGPTQAHQRKGLLADAGRWVAAELDFVQLREKSMSSGALVELASEMVKVFAARGGHTKLLVNHRADVAAAAGAAGVHLTAARGELTAAQVRAVFAAAGLARPVVSVSCHSLADAERARDSGADLVLFGPVFEKSVGGEVVVPGTGLAALRSACKAASTVRVLALGGVTNENARACVDAGAAGVAGMRLFA